MTEKRFRVTIGNKNDVIFIDTVILKQFLLLQFNDYEKASICASALQSQCDLMNELHEENTRLLSANTRLAEENTNILQTIRQAYQSERTALGRSVLKQLIENFEGE